ncbi:uncharacterized protein A1O9_10172 [Exophiala aquamarina CBS 119918]|uniref:Telomerase reverse transcriptase n=1 Tax=Exophiala aquamarina CBS 119918 TaxID=1182545 RepID=A0A072P1U2_9EURO|nr:uncharacterized protein A1O9_10172 [Exophiala aquamarina CBS 119918]KEF53771.1 hypothetical protein A1O9_10172 [Exophiala aquamarina CBS 119918]
MKRKRGCQDAPSDRPAKRHQATTSKKDIQKPRAAAVLPTVHHSVLSSYYPKVCTLRNYLLANLPASARVRRKRLGAHGREDETCILDATFVGLLKEPSFSVTISRKDDFASFTQSQHRATGAFSGKTLRYSMKEIVDFVIWLLFKDHRVYSQRPRHVLCHGLAKAAAPLVSEADSMQTTFLPGIVQQHPNDSIERLKSSTWSNIALLLGEDAEGILSNMLLDCGIFVRMSEGKDNYFQLSGIPLSELTPNRNHNLLPKTHQANALERPLDPSRIRFVRNRILYSRPALNRTGKVKVGLKHVHVFERFADTSQPMHSIHILKHVFPRQFGLHNVFTSNVDRAETAQPFKDYSIREAEIADKSKRHSMKVPYRLRGEAIEMVRKMQRNHQQCSYSQLLRYYCPVRQSTNECTEDLERRWRSVSTPGSECLLTQLSFAGSYGFSRDSPSDHYDAEASFLPHATPPEMVSVFCRSVIATLLPQNSLGTGSDGVHNLQTLLRKVDQFIKLRRFETLSLHQVMQGIRQKSIDWLRAPKTGRGQNLSKSDFMKRVELLQEYIYYVLDSILIPLIRSNFYVTESSSHRNRLFYFRHDVWRKLSEPSLATLRLNMFAPTIPSQIRRVLATRSLGYSYLRLLPKDIGSRPITNLRRRQVKLISGRRLLGPSINSQLTPLFSVLNYERSQHPTVLGSALLSVGDIHSKLSGFKRAISSQDPIYIAKMDIKSCFDSIPQNELLLAVRALFQEPAYRTTKHTEFKSVDDKQYKEEPQLQRRFVGSARLADDCAVFSERAIAQLAARKRRVVFSDTGNHRIWSRGSLLKLLQTHVQESIVKVGKKHMIQKDGIPQGSILSSLLCSYFYGMFENQELGFLDPRSCLLLRLIDDFLLITTDQILAKRFLEVMAKGDPKYGIQVNAGKSLVNFDVTINGQKVPRLHGTTWFPYCGMRIDSKTLVLQKDREKKDAHVRNSLTVETGAKAGKVLRRKVLSSLKLQMHAMLMDISLNGKRHVMCTLLANFVESAMKFHQYLGHLAHNQRPSQELIRQLIQEMMTTAHKICLAKNSRKRGIRWVEMCWLGACGFQRVLQRKQTYYSEVLVWLNSLRTESESHIGLHFSEREALIRASEKVFRGYIY